MHPGMRSWPYRVCACLCACAGRNIHALDPYRMPSPAATARGAQAAQAILDMHLAANGGERGSGLWGMLARTHTCGHTRVTCTPARKHAFPPCMFLMHQALVPARCGPCTTGAPVPRAQAPTQRPWQ